MGRTERISYREFSDRIGGCIPFHNFKGDIIGEYDIYCGDIYEKDEDGVSTYRFKDVLAYYIVSEDGTNYIKHHTDEIVYYVPKLDLYVWGKQFYGVDRSDAFLDIH